MSSDCSCVRAPVPFPHMLQEEELQEEEAKEALEDSSEASEIRFQLSCAGLQVSICTVVRFCCSERGPPAADCQQQCVCRFHSQVSLAHLSCCGCNLPQHYAQLFCMMLTPESGASAELCRPAWGGKQCSVAAGEPAG